jgi:hypothetical protein
VNDGGAAGNAVFQCTPATFDQTVGVEQQGRVRWQGHVGLQGGASQLVPQCNGVASSSIQVVQSAWAGMGGGCPALEYTSSPVSGLSTGQMAVVHSAPGSRAASPANHPRTLKCAAWVASR